MSHVISSDGTAIAFETSGQGPPLILVNGALSYRECISNRPLASALASRFTVLVYDRRGRGESGDAPSYSVEREVEDIRALVAEAGGSAFLYGISSGAALALEAAARGAGIARLALYEPPFIVDASRAPVPQDLPYELNELVASGRRGDAVKLFLRQTGIVPSIAIALLRFTPSWRKLKAVAHTLSSDYTILGDTQSGRPLSTTRWAAATMPTLVVVGGKSPTWFQHGTRALADVLPNAEHLVLEGESHMVKDKALAPLLAEFFASAADSTVAARTDRSPRAL